MKRVVITASFLLMLGCNQLNLLFPTAPTSTSGEEYAVLSALIQTMFIGNPPPKLIVIDALTAPTGTRYTDDALDRLASDVGTELIANFRAANAKPLALEQQFTITADYMFISKEELKEIFKDNDGWKIFYGKYPGSFGILSLSRPGFNAAMDTALVYVGQQSDWLAGAGHFVLMKKIDNTWTLQGKQMIWIS